MLLLLSFPCYAYRFNTSNGASFSKSKIKFYVTSNSDCNNAGVSNTELLSIAEDAADKFWNKVPTSNIELKRGGLYETTDGLFLTGELCPEQDGVTCPAASVPYINKLIIACNDNTTNFPSNDFIAIGAPTRLSGKKIKGSIVLINDTASTTFAGLSRAEKVSVLGHELGHAVGLGHSNKDEALMYYRNAEKMRRLSQDDMDGITHLYPNQLDGCGGMFGGIQKQDNTSWPGAFILGWLGYMLFRRVRKKRLNV